MFGVSPHCYLNFSMHFWFVVLQLSGFKKVLNYTKKVTDEVRFRKTVTREEIEVNDVSKEMDLDLIKQNSQVERIIADRISKDSSGDVIPEYLVKWQGLSYAEATWYIKLLRKFMS
ncbi:protein CHROMATIN REMODELING 5-like [Humulus lupulus]|uniref:protein CHROMATIN REMODELING 5-like n=1 Tax=Humulus lupulus TaxID=3486 RepID=UPI002B40B359|nr:protein CHROMATIN REMODELING 5-like [Humulus lupulus]